MNHAIILSSLLVASAGLSFSPPSWEGSGATRHRPATHGGGLFMVRRSVDERFWAKVEKTVGCWLWSGAKTKAGYGQINVDGVPIYAHRLSWEMNHGRKIPHGMQVCHRCDTPACVRPDHLQIWTQMDNVRDCINKGRARHPIMTGEQVGTSKLTADQVRQIREKYHTAEMLAKEYGVSEGTIGFILKHKTWRHIE